MDNLIGATIAGRFTITRLIGQGGMGTVYEATHHTLPRRVAIKVLRGELARRADFVERFRREAIAAAKVDHPNVVYMTDFGVLESGSAYMVMEYLEGMGLDKLLAAQSRLPLTRTLPILAQLADALDCAHAAGVVHRDLKPENILLTEARGRSDVVKILDFGIAKLKGPSKAAESLTVHGQVFGTAEYMSPEQATGEPVDGRSDVYALGCLAYEMITGNPPFVGMAIRVLQAHVNETPQPPSTRLKDHPLPPLVDAMVLRCLAKSPDDRYGTAGELRQDILKVRGSIYGMGELLAGKGRPRRRSGVPRKALTEGWQSLGARVPEVLSEGGSGTWSVSVQALLGEGGDERSAAQREQLYYDTLRELALALVRANIASPEINMSLERLLVIQEEVASLTGTIALAEQNFDRIRFEFGQREKRLGGAILELNMSRATLLGRAEAYPPQRPTIQHELRDLDFQIAELSRSCDQVRGECNEQIQRLHRDVDAYRTARREREEEAKDMYQTLHATLEALRPRATDEASLALFEKLDRSVRARVGL